MIAGQEDSAATLGVGTVNTASAAMMNANVDWASIHFLPLVFHADLRFHGRVVPAFDPRVPRSRGATFSAGDASSRAAPVLETKYSKSAAGRRHGFPGARVFPGPRY